MWGVLMQNNNVIGRIIAILSCLAEAGTALIILEPFQSNILHPRLDMPVLSPVGNISTRMLLDPNMCIEAYQIQAY